MKNISYYSELVKRHHANHARVMKIHTAHGEIITPAFMPVATRAFVNYMTPEDLHQTHTQILLGGNTYHMLCSPGLEVIEQIGGMHPLMGWNGPMLTDSGGFQVFSLAKNRKICSIDEKGAHFKHPNSGKIIHLTPKISIEAQKIIGADIIMAFDQCTPETGGREIALLAMEHTHRWLVESKQIYEQNPKSAYGYSQALFGIIQGGSFLDLREQSTQFILSLDLDGIAIGGEVIGFDREKTAQVLKHIGPLLPENKIRYTMGVGLHPQDLIEVVALGVDIFDCVGPTRNARHGSLYCGKVVEKNDWFSFEGSDKGEGDKISIKKGIYAKDESPIMPDCDCHTCQHYSRAYLHYLIKEKSFAYCHLACIHNVRVMQRVCEVMRAKILADSASDPGEWL